LCPDCIFDAALIAAELNDIRQDGLTFGRTVVLAADVTGAAIPSVLAVTVVLSRGGRAAARGANLTRWGWEGGKKQRAILEQLSRPGMHTDLDGVIPTRKKAERLIYQAGGRIERIEKAHPDVGHPYHHINYVTKS